VEAALIDYRDVLAWAEYPEQMRTGKMAYNTTAEEIKAMRERDWEQYRTWIEEDEV
jgi:hypothetical protein